MATLFNRVGQTSTTTGTSTVTLGAALVSTTSINACSFQTSSQAGIANGDITSYLILDTNGNWEYGTGTFSSGTLTRTLGQSATGSLLNLTGAAQIFLTARSQDIGSADAEYVTLATNTRLTAERVLVAGGGLTSSDTGAGGNVTLAVGAGTGITVNADDVAVNYATQAQQEAASATNVAVNPSVQQYHPSAAKAWVRWNNAGTIAASYNVTSVTDNGAGDWTINFTVSFSSSNYGLAACGLHSDGGNVMDAFGQYQSSAPSSNSCRMTNTQADIPAASYNGAADNAGSRYWAAFYGDQ